MVVGGGGVALVAVGATEEVGVVVVRAVDVVAVVFLGSEVMGVLAVGVVELRCFSIWS